MWEDDNPEDDDPEWHGSMVKLQNGQPRRCNRSKDPKTRGSRHLIRILRLWWMWCREGDMLMDPDSHERVALSH
jgi:hypothetical protein